MIGGTFKPIYIPNPDLPNPCPKKIKNHILSDCCKQARKEQVHLWTQRYLTKPRLLRKLLSTFLLPVSPYPNLASINVL